METQLVQGGRQRPKQHATTHSTVQPIYTSTTYLHGDAEALDQAFAGTLPGDTPGYIYARQGNPNAFTLEEVIAQAEGGVGAVAVGSGMAAIHLALLAAGLVPGCKVLAALDLYGQTTALLRNIFVPLGVELILHDLCCADVAACIRAEQPDVVYVETLSNPLVKVADLDAIGAASQEVGAISLVDNTFATPYLVQPVEHGFDLVIHSATKYLGGHGDSTGGIVISSKKVLFNQLRNYAPIVGAVLSPFESYLLLRGVRTLALRMERQCDNALQVAHFLQGHRAIERVHYPGLSDHPQHDLASRLLDHHLYGGLLSFELKSQSREGAYRFMDHLHLCLPATTLGDIYSLVSYPPMSSHRNLKEAELRSIGITAGCIRLSVGIENVADIIADLDQALIS